MIGVRVQEVTLLNLLKLGARGTVEDIFSNRVITRWNQLDQGAVDVN